MTMASVGPFGVVRRLTLILVRERELVTTPEAARQLGISARTLQRYVNAGWITPQLTLPSGRYRWDVARLRDQINALGQGGEPDE